MCYDEYKEGISMKQTVKTLVSKSKFSKDIYKQFNYEISLLNLEILTQISVVSSILGFVLFVVSLPPINLTTQPLGCFLLFCVFVILFFFCKKVLPEHM